MDIENVKIITNGIAEVAKIVGPAIITAIFGYKVGKSQLEGKLRELEKTYAYSASEKLFEYYQNREKELDESYNSINKDMGILFGLDMTLDLAADNNSLNKTKKIYDLYEKTLPYQIKLTLRDLKKYTLQETEEFRKLESFLDQKALQGQEKSWSDRISYLLEVYFHLRICNKMILEEISTNYMKIFIKK